MEPITFIDLFAGIGGIRLGFEQSCDDLGVPHKCVFSSEIEKKALSVYSMRFGEDAYFDITTVTPSNVKKLVPKFSVMLAGFPCQSFSRAGRQGGFDDIRGTLFFRLATIIEKRRPKAFLLENVDNLPRHDGGRTLWTILDVLRNRLGYDSVGYAVLNAKDFGVPQNRDRIYIVGFDKGLGGGFKFPRPEEQSPQDRMHCIGDIVEDQPVDPKHYISEKYFTSLKRHRQKHEDKGHGFGYIVLDRSEVAKAIVCGGMGRERNMLHDPRQTDMGKYADRADPSMTRFMTPKEWERLQGFPDDWTACVADTVRYKLLGNSVAVPVIRAIGKRVVEELINPKPFNGKWVGDNVFDM